MDQKQFEKQYEELKPSIKQKWTKFSDQEIKRINGDLNLFINHLQKKYGVSRKAAEKELEHLVSPHPHTEKNAHYAKKGQHK